MTLRDIPNTEYENYFQLYVNKNKLDHTIPEALLASHDALCSLLRSKATEDLTKGYAPGKWSPLQVMQHLIDCEKVFVYRALAFARADKTVLPGFEQDSVEYSNANARTLEDLLEEYSYQRHGTIRFYATLTEEMLARSGQASTNTLTVRALAYVIAGHDQHHIQLFHERYFSS